jgi:hypothetical protein
MMNPNSIILKALEKVEDCSDKRLIRKPSPEIRKTLNSIGRCREKMKFSNCGECEKIHYCEKISKLFDLVDEICFECMRRSGCRLFENLSTAVKVLI